MVFRIEEQPSDSPFIERIWRAQAESTGTLISQAAIHSEMVVTRYNGTTIVTIRGPETKATPLPVQQLGADFFGITFKLATFMPHLPPKTLLDGRDANLAAASNQSFWLDGSTWQIPTYENADIFVDRLVREGILVRDPVVETVLQGYSPELSRRSIQYRFLQATGLTQSTIHQIQRARHAASLLERGISILDTVAAAGYADQSHLTRALKRFMGQTPAQISHMHQLD